ncbi:hypothetical protein VoSk93_21000 [Vibrio owensii]
MQTSNALITFNKKIMNNNFHFIGALLTALLLAGCSTTYNISGDVKLEVHGDLITTERDTFEVLNDAKVGL